jgi:hypothetical protein
MAKTKTKDSERRISKRSTIQVLVTCLTTASGKRKRGDSSGWEMWARDLADDGVGLRWSRSWALSRSTQAVGTMTRRQSDYPAYDTASPSQILKKGMRVKLDGLVYGAEGAVLMQGVIQWVRPSKDGKTCDFGVAIVGADHRSFFKALKAVTP